MKGDCYEALKGIMAFIDEGVLVRNTQNDSDPNWAIHQMPLVLALSKAKSALENVAPHTMPESEFEQAFLRGVGSVLRIRCTKHYTVPQFNSNEVSGGECGACIAEKSSGPSPRIVELAERMVAVGQFPQISASEGHEVADYIFELHYGKSL
jgi:hypothetical protein